MIEQPNSRDLPKPVHLITLLDTSGPKKCLSYFISLDKPDMLANLIGTKGFFVKTESITEDEIRKNYVEYIKSTSKESYRDILFPIHRIQCIQSLVFKQK